MSTLAIKTIPDTESIMVAQSKLIRRKMTDSSITLVVFVVLFAVFAFWLGTSFLNVQARMMDVHQNVPILLLGLAAVVTLVPGKFDLSVAGTATLSCFLTIGLTVREGWPFWLVLICSIGVGLVIGLVNGFIVEKLRVNAFIATLGTGGIAGGIAAVYSGGVFLGPQPGGPTLPEWFVTFSAFSSKAPAWIIAAVVLLIAITVFLSLDHIRPPTWEQKMWLRVRIGTLAVIVAALVIVLLLTDWLSAVSWQAFFLLVVALVLWVLMEYTTTGRHLQAVGSNRSAALLAGVKAKRQVMKSYLIGGVIAALAGVMLAGSQGSAAPDVAASFLLPAFAAAFLSTVVLSDGRFTVTGTVIGGVFLVWVGQALILGGVQATWIPVVNGVVLVGAVALSSAMGARR